MRFVLLITTALCFSTSALADPTKADDFYCKDRGLGDYFYCKAPEPEPEEKVKPKAAPAPVTVKKPKKDEDIEALENFQVKLSDARKKAVWNPTKDNVRDFMQLQIVMADRADKFAGVFTRLGWQEPDLSYSVKDPTNRAGLQTFRANERQAELQHMKKLSERYGVFYFYSKNCAACEVFSPIMKMFSEMHSLDVMAVSMDGGPNFHFPNWRPDNGIARGLGLNQGITPAVILFDTKTNKTEPVSFGMISLDELEMRIFELTGGEVKGYLGLQEEWKG